MSISISHLSLARVWSRLAGFLLALLVFTFIPATSVSAVTEEQILEQLRAGAATYELNQNNGIMPDDEPDPSLSVPALDDQSINIEGHILIIASSIAVLAGAGTIMLMLRRKSAV